MGSALRISTLGGLLAEARYIGSRTWFPSCVSVFEAPWAYKLYAPDADDLSIAAEDIMTIVEETNADW